MSFTPPSFTATIGVGPPEKVGTKRLPYPILVNIVYDGPKLQNLATSYTCDVWSEGLFGENGEWHSTGHSGYNIEGEAKIGGIIAFRRIPLPEHTCQCRLKISLSHKDSVLERTYSSIVLKPSAFMIEKDFTKTKVIESEAKSFFWKVILSANTSVLDPDDIQFIEFHKEKLSATGVYKELEPYMGEFSFSGHSSTSTLVEASTVVEEEGSV